MWIILDMIFQSLHVAPLNVVYLLVFRKPIHISLFWKQVSELRLPDIPTPEIVDKEKLIQNLQCSKAMVQSDLLF